MGGKVRLKYTRDAHGCHVRKIDKGMFFRTSERASKDTVMPERFLLNKIVFQPKIYPRGGMNMKKRFISLCAAMIVGMSVGNTFAGKLLYEKEAKELYDLGLYKGISTSNYEPGLEEYLTREDVIVILIWIFEQQGEVSKMSDGGVKAALEEFEDANDISGDIRKEVAYAVKKGYIKGINVNGRTYLNPKGQLKGEDFACLVLQWLNIKDFSYNHALDKLESEGILTTVQKKALNKSRLQRDDVVGVSFNTLKIKEKKDGKNISDKVNKKKIEQSNIIHVTTPTPEVVPSKETQGTTLKRASNAAMLGRWKLTNERREDVNVNRIWFTAEYTGQVDTLKARDVTDFSVEDIYGNVYAVFTDINGNPNDDIKTCVIAKKRVEMSVPFVIPASSNEKIAEKELVLYGRIKETATPGGMIEVFLGDGINIYEAKGTKSDADVRIKGNMMQQEEDGKKLIALSNVVAKMGAYNTEPIARANVPVARVELVNDGFHAIKMKQLRFKELINSTKNTTYTLRNEEMENVATATRTKNGEIIFTLKNGGEKIAGLGKELFTVQLNDKPEKGTSIQLKLLAEETYYDSSDDKGYKMDIDSGVLLDETVFRE